MHITSLPSPYGIGSLGKEAFAFADFLAAHGQRYWQMLPVGPTGYADSPYQAFSSFAGNPYLIDLDLLAEQGLLTQDDLRGARALPFGNDPRAVDFAAVRLHRDHALRAAYRNRAAKHAGEAEAFAREQAHWLPDYALFMALKARHGMRPWAKWEESLRLRAPRALAWAREALAEEIGYHCFVQHLFYKQWGDLRAYCRKKNVFLIGDIPFYAAMDSADVWANPEYFLLDEEKNPLVVAGVPPDYFSPTGQLWGNPIFDWARLRQTGYDWWLRRMAAAVGLFDLLRIDHFRGFASYWQVPYGEETAVRGEWNPGPGLELIAALKEKFPEYPFIAEDLGIINEDVLFLLERSGFPGMKVLQFAFDHTRRSLHLPHKHTENSVCYTGTHDNPTALGFLREAEPEHAAFAVEYLGLHEGEGLHWGFIRGAAASPARLFICPMQDVLGSPLRMNTPGTVYGNWRWRMLPGEASREAAARLHRYTRMFGRE